MAKRESKRFIKVSLNIKKLACAPKPAIEALR
jgi:hypothetical protein